MTREALSAAVAAEDYRQAARCKRQLAAAQKEQRDFEKDAARKTSARSAAEDVLLAAQQRSRRAAEELGAAITRAAEVALEQRRERSERALNHPVDESSEPMGDYDDEQDRGNELEQQHQTQIKREPKRRASFIKGKKSMRPSVYEGDVLFEGLAEKRATGRLRSAACP